MNLTALYEQIISQHDDAQVIDIDIIHGKETLVIKIDNIIMEVRFIGGKYLTLSSSLALITKGMIKVDKITLSEV